MGFRRRRGIGVAIQLVVLTTVLQSASAQGKGVLIGAPPKPGQSQRVSLTQASDMTLVAEGVAPPKGIPAEGLRMESLSTTVVRQSVGQPDAQGRVRHDLTFESMVRSTKMNGREMPTPPGGLPDLAGKTFTIWLDGSNQVVDVGLPEGLPVTAQQAKQLFAPLLSAIPRAEMQIGESVTRPMALAIPVPGAGGRAGGTLDATTRTTLVKIDGAGAARVATLATAFEGSLNGAAGASAGQPIMSLKGTGSTQLDLGTGLVVASSSENLVEGRILPPGGDGSKAMAMRGTVRVTLTRLK